MIYVEGPHLSQIEYLLAQSRQGVHLLFDSSTLRGILCERSISEEEAYAAEPYIERLLAEPNFERKKAYLESLAPETQKQVVRTYFNILENSIYESEGAIH